jgi:hypothetical protein
MKDLRPSNRPAFSQGTNNRGDAPPSGLHNSSIMNNTQDVNGQGLLFNKSFFNENDKNGGLVSRKASVNNQS